MEYKYHSFLDNRSIEDAKDIFKQRLDDATYIYNKYNLVLYLSSSGKSLEKTVTALYQKEY